MKEPLQSPPKHSSYTQHRRQFWMQIFLPITLATLLVIVIAIITSIAAFGRNNNSVIWAAISTIWLIMPVLLFALVSLIINAALIYMLARALQIIPSYSFKAQSFVYRAASKIQDFSDMAVKPVLFVEGLKASLKAFFGRD